MKNVTTAAQTEAQKINFFITNLTDSIARNKAALQNPRLGRMDVAKLTDDTERCERRLERLQRELAAL